MVRPLVNQTVLHFLRIPGPVVRLSPNELSFNSVQAWEDIYGHRLGRTNMAKDPIHVGAVDRKIRNNCNIFSTY